MSEREQELPEGIVDSITWDELTDGKWPLSWWYVRNSMDAYFSKRLLFDHVDPIHLDTVPALLQYGKYKAWKLDQANAKIKELRELLQAAVEAGKEPHGQPLPAICDTCGGIGRGVGSIEHGPDCRLGQAIDRILAEEKADA